METEKLERELKARTEDSINATIARFKKLDAMKRIEADCTIKVLQEVSPLTGKPMWSNEDAREAALQVALHSHPEYTTLRTHELDLLRTKTLNDVELEVVRFRMQLVLLEKGLIVDVKQ
jgi:hypothetical protein